MAGASPCKKASGKCIGLNQFAARHGYASYIACRMNAKKGRAATITIAARPFICYPLCLFKQFDNLPSNDVTKIVGVLKDGMCAVLRDEATAAGENPKHLNAVGMQDVNAFLN